MAERYYFLFNTEFFGKGVLPDRMRRALGWEAFFFVRKAIACNSLMLRHAQHERPAESVNRSF